MQSTSFFCSPIALDVKKKSYRCACSETQTRALQKEPVIGKKTFKSLSKNKLGGFYNKHKFILILDYLKLNAADHRVCMVLLRRHLEDSRPLHNICVFCLVQRTVGQAQFRQYTKAEVNFVRGKAHSLHTSLKYRSYFQSSQNQLPITFSACKQLSESFPHKLDLIATGFGIQCQPPAQDKVPEERVLHTISR